ncbi:MAG: type IV toxin-antitoxin system AbiEi family antitoxin [Vicinamibacterales bacterium]
MTRNHIHDLQPYRARLRTWIPGSQLRAAGNQLPFDGLLTLRGDSGERRYLVDEKRHLRVEDAAVVAEHMVRRRTELAADHASDGLLLLAPHVRPQQAAILERAGIDYIDLAGNAHLHAPGLLVHVEGRRPIKEPVRGPARPHKAWVKTVMALLVQPDLVRAPYRTIAEHADVALGAVGGCMKDLALRGALLDGKAGRELVDRTALIAVWATAYAEALRPKLKERRLQVRAGDKEGLVAGLADVLGKRKTPWALTGADAAAHRTHFFRAEETEIYAPINVFEDRGLQRALVAQPTERGGNLLVIEPPGPLAMPLPPYDRVPVAPDLLAYAELRFRGTDQANEAADLLLPLVLNDAPR